MLSYFDLFIYIYIYIRVPLLLMYKNECLYLLFVFGISSYTVLLLPLSYVKTIILICSWYLLYPCCCFLYCWRVRRNVFICFLSLLLFFLSISCCFWWNKNKYLYIFVVRIIIFHFRRKVNRGLDYGRDMVGRASPADSWFWVIYIYIFYSW